jgi:glycosyltransferase involved in cell wall biosynthesis
MSTQKKIAFYAPLKPPDHPIPSGDRQMARMLLSALNVAGYDAFLASRYISYSKRHGAEYLTERKNGAIAEADRLADLWSKTDISPDLWFCYHPYDKSPDWLGMEICRRLDIPMVTAEPCKTGQGPNGEWLPWRAEAQAGIRMARMNIVMTPSDRDYLDTFIEPDRITELKPFIDRQLLEYIPAKEDPWQITNGEIRLLSVGMMRAGAKLDSYALLAKALSQTSTGNWKLLVIGEGPARKDIEPMFDWAVHEKIRFAGEKSQAKTLGIMQQADILAWPGIREAYGMVYLEAASFGVPSVAVNNMGVPEVVKHGQTGLLAEFGDAGAYTACLDRLIGDSVMRGTLGKGAKAFMENERSVTMAASRLREIINPVLAETVQANV